jgi:uncharacterized protein
MRSDLRSTERREISVRTAGNSVSGHALRYDSLSEDLGGFVEVIKPGACRDVLRDDVRALFNHDPNLILARTQSGTLQLRDDGRGLFMDFRLGDQTYAQDLRISMSRGDVTQCSFSFDIALDRWTVQPGGILLREILQLKRLYDVSVVVFPAYPDTDAGLRDGKTGASREDWRMQYRRRRLELLTAELVPTSARTQRSTGENMNTEFRFREKAVDQGPHYAKRVAAELMDEGRCPCGGRLDELTIDRRSGSVAGRCAMHRESRVQTTGDRRVQLDLIERELRQGASR